MSVWTSISSTRLDADSPIDEDLTTDLDDNAKSIRERQLRTGIHALGVRLALARGEKAASVAISSGLGTSIDTITFSSDATDGNPNFSAAPTVLGLTFEELSTGVDIGTSDPAVSCYIEEGGPTTTTLAVVTSVQDAANDGTLNFLIHWAVVGPVTSGE